MENFQTEEQQVEAIKGFWKEHGNSVIAGIVLGFAGFIGFNVYKDSKLESEIAVTDSFIALKESADKTTEDFTAKAESFIQANTDSAYASLTAFALAKEAVNKKDWAGAEKHLSTAAEKAVNPGLKALASIRLARVQLQSEQSDKALATLSGSFPEAFLPTVEALKGDVYLAQGKKELARAAYQTAIDNKGLESDPSLQIKFDDLAQSSAIIK